MDTETSSIILKLLISGILGGVIGFERDMHGRAAGLRTNLLVSMGSALFMIISEIVANRAAGTTIGRFADPGRIAAQIITGIGFIGAGAIIKEGFSIRGLTTAACLWLVAGIGMAVGAGLFMLGFYSTLIAITCLAGLKNLDKLYPRDSYRTLVIETPNETDLGDVVKPIKQFGELKILYFDFDRNYNTGVTTVKLTIRLFHKGITDKLSHSIIQSFLVADISVKRIKWDHNY